MPITLAERIDSPQWTADEAISDIVKHYWLSGTTSAIDVNNTLAAVSSTHNGLSKLGYNFEPLSDDLWECWVRYGRKDEWSVQFDTTGGQSHKSVSYSTPGSYFAPGVTAFSTFGAIGVTKDSIEGVDIQVPKFAIQITRRIPVASMTSNYIAGLYDLTGKTNAAQYVFSVQGITFTFGPRELLFEGASAATKNTDGYWDLSYKLAASISATGLTFGPINGIAKKGWEYLWASFVEDTDGDRTIKKPIAVFIEQVYQDGDFNALGFPSP